MKVPQELARELANVYNILSGIPTAGDATIKMAACLAKLRGLVIHAEVVPEENESRDEAS